MEFKTLSEKVAYLKGLMAGLNTEDKVIALMADILCDMANEIEETQCDIGELSEVVDTIDEDLGELERDFYEIDEDDECDCGCGHHHFDECDCDDDDEYDEEEYDEFFDDDEELYEVVCPTCSDTICLNEDMINEGSMACPNCGELLEFNLDDEDEEEDSE